MSDRSDPSVLELLDRADELSPAMSVEPAAVIAAGRRKARRRRTSVAGGVGALALVGALWLGGPLNPLAPGDPPAPAAISWQEGVDVDLFDNGANPEHEPDRVHWTGELRSAAGDAFPQLVLTRDGEQLEPVAAEDGPGDVLVFRADGISVAVWQSPGGSRGERPLWEPGVFASQDGPVEVDGTELRYSAAEVVPGGTGELAELYWFTEEAAHAASGAPVASAVLTAGETRTLVMLDEQRNVWGAANLGHPAGLVSVERLVSDVGLSGWMGEDVSATSVGVLPEGASAPVVGSESTALAQAQLGSRTAVLAADPTLVTGTPVIRYTLEGEEHQLVAHAEHERTLDVGSVQLLVIAQPDAVEVRRGEKWAHIPVGDLADGRAVVAPVMGGQVIVVPGWDAESTPEDLRVLVGSDDDLRWVEAKSAYADRLFDGRPLVVLGLDRGVVGQGESVRGVGHLDGDDVVQLELEDGVVTLDLGL